jgi:threonine/homoserine/homoserine lactone efflux protein
MSTFFEHIVFELSGLAIFALTYAFFVASPGPAVAAIVARALATGARRTFPFLFGIALGDVIWFTLAVTGLAAVARHYEAIVLALQYAGALYLVYLAYKIWRSSPEVNQGAADVKGEGLKLFLGGLALCLGNPKPIIFFLALLPTVINIEDMSLIRYGVIASVIVVILLLSLGAYVILADRARHLLKTPRALRIVNHATAVMMLIAAIAIAVRSA